MAQRPEDILAGKPKCPRCHGDHVKPAELEDDIAADLKARNRKAFHCELCDWVFEV